MSDSNRAILEACEGVAAADYAEKLAALNAENRPWCVIDQAPIAGINIAGCRLKSIASIADAPAGSITTVIAEMVSEHDAEWIVKCVNEREALLQQISMFRQALESIATLGSPWAFELQAIARNALKGGNHG